MARLLMIISSARSIDLVSEKGRQTGYSADEVLKPYDKFVAAGVEVVAATPDGKPPYADPFTLEPQFHYPDEDKDFLSQVVRSFAPDLDDIRVTLHHLTELDLQECEAKGKKDATFWRLTSPVTPAILRGVGCARGGSTLLGGSGVWRKTPDSPCDFTFSRIAHFGRTKKLSTQTI